VCATALQAAVIEHLAKFLGAAFVIARELDALVAEFRHSGDGPRQILCAQRANRVKLYRDGIFLRAAWSAPANPSPAADAKARLEIFRLSNITESSTCELPLYYVSLLNWTTAVVNSQTESTICKVDGNLSWQSLDSALCERPKVPCGLVLVVP